MLKILAIFALISVLRCNEQVFAYDFPIYDSELTKGNKVAIIEL